MEFVEKTLSLLTTLYHEMIPSSVPEVSNHAHRSQRGKKKGY
jgi:hypothetical protein